MEIRNYINLFQNYILGILDLRDFELSRDGHLESLHLRQCLLGL